MSITILILIVLVLIILITFAYSALTGAPYVPTISSDIPRILEIANIQSGDKFYDLGCGDGKMLIAASKKGAQCYGFDISLFPYILAKIRRLFSKNKKNIHIKYKNFWKVDLSDADIIYFFHSPKYKISLRNKLQKEIKPGAKVVTYLFSIPEWIPLLSDKPPGKPPIYLYKKERNV